MSNRAEVLEVLNSEWDSLIELSNQLTPEQWATPALCPGWTVHGVYVHLTAVEEALSKWWPSSADDPPPFEKIVSGYTELNALSPDELRARFEAVVATRRDELSALDEDAWSTPCLTPVGPGTYASFMEIRVFDCWVHERDARVPLGINGDDGGVPGQMAIDMVEGALGYIVGKRAGFTEGNSVVFDITGAAPRRLCVAVNGRATVVDDVADPTVTVTTDSLTFMLLACGRIDPEGPIADGRISWVGDDELGGRVARNMKFTM